MICTVAVLSACGQNVALGEFRQTIPKRIDGLAWPLLSPIGDFAPNPVIGPEPDPRSLAQRAIDLRIRARELRGPVLEPRRKRAMIAALRRYNQG